MALVNDILSAIDKAKKGNVVEASSKIKRCIGMRKKGGRELLSIKTINGQLLEELLNLAKKNKNIEPLNQALQMIAIDEEDYNKQKRIYKQILGYKGTSINDLSPEYIEEIIREKIDLENGINQEDIIGILKQVITKAETDYNLDNEEKKKYIKLVEDTIIPVVDHDIESEAKDVTDIRILEIVTKLGKLYTPNHKKAYSIFEKGKKLDQFKGTEIYEENSIECDKADLLKEFKPISCNEKNFKQVVKQYLDTFLKEVKPKNPNPKHRAKNPNSKPSSQAEALDLDKKLDAILYLINELKKDFPNAGINGIFVGKGVFAKNILVPIDNVPITILEDVSGKSGALYMTQNSNIGAFSQLKLKNTAKNFKNVKTANHIKNYEKYKKNIVDRAKEIIDNLRKNGTIDSERSIKVYSGNMIDVDTIEYKPTYEEPILEEEPEELVNEDVNEETNENEITQNEDKINDDDVEENEIEESIPEVDIDKTYSLEDLSIEELERFESELDNEIKEKNKELIDLDKQLEEAKLQEKKLLDEAKKEEFRKRIREKQKIRQSQNRDITDKKSELHTLNMKLKKNKNIGNQD